MRMLAIAAVASVALSSAAVAQTGPAPVVATRTTHVHTRTVTHDDGKAHPQINRVVRRSTVATPAGVATRTTVSTTRTPPR